MSEAFEVGITLALTDGVSESIASTKRDMARLEQVLQAGGVSIRQLRMAAAQVSSPTRQAEVVRQTTPEDRSAASKESDDVTSARLPESPSQQEVTEQTSDRAPLQVFPDVQVVGASPPVVEQRPAATQRPISLASPVGSTGTPTGDAANQPSRPQHTPAPVNDGQPSVVMMIMPSASAPLSSLRSDVAPGVNYSTRQSSFVEHEEARPVSDSHRFGWAPPLDVVSPNAATPDVLSHAPAPSFYAAPPPSEPNFAVPSGDLSRSAAPISRFYVPPDGSGDSENHRAEREQAPAAPTPSASTSGPMEGDVFLDGALLGRWMSKHLTQQAGRASTGPTGFDPRRGRLLPGAAVGT